MKNFISVVTTSLHSVLIAVDCIESVDSEKYSDYVDITMKSGNTYTVIDNYTGIAKRIRDAQE